MKRRSFLKKSALVSLPAVMGGFSLSAMPSRLMSSLINGDNDRVLVLIDLNGGNDGLHTFIPLDAYDNLANARQNIILPENQLLDFTDTIGLHPEMTGIKNLYDNGNLTVVQGVGYPNQNRSHFRSADIWNTASAANEYLDTGWLGRYLDQEHVGYPEGYPNEDCPDPFAITMGSTISGTCQGGQSNFSMAILNTNNIGGLTTGVEVPLPEDCYGDEMGFLIETFKKSNAYAERVIEAADMGNTNSGLYPNSRLADRLKTIARLISGGLQTKIYVVQLGGFDTHADQVDSNDNTEGNHAYLLRTLSDAIYAFQEDIKAMGLQDRVLGMTFSEFGRKIRSNAGLGTDHGSAAPMMFFGNCLNPGIIGANPEIATNVDIEEGVAMQYDFRSIYGSVLKDWFEVSEEDITNLLIPDFQYVPVLGACQTTSTNDINLEMAAEVFPNPCDNYCSLVLTIADPDSYREHHVRIDLFDVVGKLIRNISDQSLSAGEHRIGIEMHSQTNGVYFVRTQIDDAVQTLRVVKQ